MGVIAASGASALNKKMESLPFEKLCSSLADHVRHLEGERNPYTAPARHMEVQAYLEESLRRLGAGILRHHRFAWKGAEGLNLILELEGQEAGPPVLIGAHYDSVPGSPGADDNASGVAVLLELARLLAQRPPRQPVWLVAFDLEEWKMRGSRALAGELRRHGPKPSWMLSLEMVGYRRREPGSQRYPFPFRWFYPNTADFILLLGNTKAHRLLRHMARVLEMAGVKTERFTVPLKGWAIPPTRLSDQSPFWDIGVAAVMMTDTAWQRNPNYHAPTDRAETLDFQFMADIVKGLFSLLQ